MSKVKQLIALVVMLADTSRYVRSKSYLLRSGSLQSGAGEALEPEPVFTGRMVADSYKG
jgi:hypothetical protein